MIEKLILGTVQMGLEYGVNNSLGKISLAKSHIILGEAYRSGIRYLDTAEAYGEAHRVIGEFHKINSETVFKVITKLPSGETLNNLRARIELYINTLQIHKIEVLMFHSFQSYNNYKTLFPELAILKQQNVIKKIGVSIYTNEELKELIADPYVEVIQLPFNLLDNDGWRGNLLKQAKHQNKAIHTRSVFLQGLFFRPAKDFPDQLKDLVEPIKNLERLASGFNITMSQMAMSYALNKNYIDGVLFGVDSIDHLKSNIDYVELPEKLIECIDSTKVDNHQLLNPSTWNLKK